MVQFVEDPRWEPTGKALARLVRRGARLHEIREHGGDLLKLRWVDDYAAELRAARSALLEKHSDGRAEALREILKSCIGPWCSLPTGKLLWIMLDLDCKKRGTSATARRQIAGEEFRGKNGESVTASTIRQIHEPRAIGALTGVLLVREDAHIAKRAS